MNLGKLMGVGCIWVWVGFDEEVSYNLIDNNLMNN